MESKKKERVVFYLDRSNRDLLFNHCELIQVKTSFFLRNAVLEKLGKPILEIKLGTWIPNPTFPNW